MSSSPGLDLSQKRRVFVEGIDPCVECGRWPVKRVVGDLVEVKADVFADGHDWVAAALLYRSPSVAQWVEVPMVFVDNDRWQAAFPVGELGLHRYAVEGWVDTFKTWRHDLEKRLNAGQDVKVDLKIGAELVDAARQRALGTSDAKLLAKSYAALATPLGAKTALGPELTALMERYPDRGLATRSQEFEVSVERLRARFSSWYEIFPRSTSPNVGAHGTFHTLLARLPEISAMGFDVVYLPPIHPIGKSFRKGPNNAPEAGAGDPGSPWGIGGEEGGHRAIHPDLGTLDDFREVIGRARELGMEIALDIALQCSPDHPYVRDHPDWFRRRPDGSIQYAENPPKRYQDIYPFDFETESWRELWVELEGVFRFWIEQGVGIFRVDNPHTKPLRFWEWLIHSIRRDHPEIIFLAEAFTRPKVMYELAKRGFSQSYTYFTWRTTAEELTAYFTELTQTEVGETFRPNLWPNTPDILPVHLQVGGRPTFIARVILAATLGASFGVYGPAYELCENVPLEPGKEEYQDSEKYQIRSWDTERADSLRPLLATLNRIRKQQPALQTNSGLTFHDTGNPGLIAYSKRDQLGGPVILTIVNLDPFRTQTGWVHFPAEAAALDPGAGFKVTDQLTGSVFSWGGTHHYVELNPAAMPAHVLVVGQG